MSQQPPSRFWVIRHQDQSEPQVVAKFDSETDASFIPDAVVDADAFQILELSSQSALADETIDHSPLSESERELLRQIYPVD